MNDHDQNIVNNFSAAEISAAQEPVVEAAPVSYFDGNLFQLIAWCIFGAIITILTLGICFPWAYCMIYEWQAEHTVVDGKRLSFDGTAMQLFGNWIKWLLLTIVTLGIYGFFVGIQLMKWKAKHTHFAA